LISRISGDYYKALRAFISSYIKKAFLCNGN
jgi:hypothetical protein